MKQTGIHSVERNSESRRHLLGALGQERSALEGDLLHSFREAAEAMKQEKEKRLCDAVAQIADALPHGSLALLAHQAPSDLIGMFDGAQLQACAP